MPGMMEHLQTINSFVRTLLALVVAGGIGTAGYYGYRTYTAAEREAEAEGAATPGREQKLQAKDEQLAVSQQELESGSRNGAEGRPRSPS